MYFGRFVLVRGVKAVCKFECMCGDSNDKALRTLSFECEHGTQITLNFHVHRLQCRVLWAYRKTGLKEYEGPNRGLFLSLVDANSIALGVRRLDWKRTRRNGGWWLSRFFLSLSNVPFSLVNGHRWDSL